MKHDTARVFLYLFINCTFSQLHGIHT